MTTKVNRDLIFKIKLSLAVLVAPWVQGRLLSSIQKAVISKYPSIKLAKGEGHIFIHQIKAKCSKSKGPWLYLSWKHYKICVKQINCNRNQKTWFLFWEGIQYKHNFCWLTYPKYIKDVRNFSIHIDLGCVSWSWWWYHWYMSSPRCQTE